MGSSLTFAEAECVYELVFQCLCQLIRSNRRVAVVSCYPNEVELSLSLCEPDLQLGSPDGWELK